jgi:hypothetical protein
MFKISGVYKLPSYDEFLTKLTLFALQGKLAFKTITIVQVPKEDK